MTPMAIVPAKLLKRACREGLEEGGLGVHFRITESYPSPLPKEPNMENLI